MNSILYTRVGNAKQRSSVCNILQSSLHDNCYCFGFPPSRRTPLPGKVSYYFIALGLVQNFCCLYCFSIRIYIILFATFVRQCISTKHCKYLFSRKINSIKRIDNCYNILQKINYIATLFCVLSFYSMCFSFFSVCMSFLSNCPFVPLKKKG